MFSSSSSSDAIASPSFWIQSSWRGDRTLKQLCANRVPTEKMKGSAGTVALHALYGSWNSVPKADHSGILRLLDFILHPHSRRDIQYVTGRVEVDSSEEDLERYCMENSEIQKDEDTNDSNNPISLPCPPQHLPVLLLVIQRSSMKHPEVRFLSLSPQEILGFWKGKKMLATQVPGRIHDEIEHILNSFGLGKPTMSPTISSPLSPRPRTPKQPAVRIFIAGDRMSVGKTSVCLGLLGSLIRKGYSPESLAYIKPATQNEKPQLVQKYCERMGIPCVPVGPIVYYRGFTRAFLAGETETSSELLAKVQESVDKLAEGKRVVIVDGVGFPAVGSICGTDNASVSKASGYPDEGTGDGEAHRAQRRRPIGVLVVGGPGVGGAVDAFNLNATYFERAKVPVLGAIFNKLSLDGFYSLANCKKQIESYFSQNEHQQHLGRQAFGFVPLFPGIVGESAMSKVHDFIQTFHEHVDIDAVLQAATRVQVQSFPEEMDIDDGIDTDRTHTLSVRPPTKRLKVGGKRNRTRQEIEGDAIQAGAAPSA